jgi:hypothetical protein
MKGLFVFFPLFAFFILQARLAAAVTAPLAEKAVFARVLLFPSGCIRNIYQTGYAFYSAIGHKITLNEVFFTNYSIFGTFFKLSVLIKFFLFMEKNT